MCTLRLYSKVNFSKIGEIRYHCPLQRHVRPIYCIVTVCCELLGPKLDRNLRFTEESYLIEVACDTPMGRTQTIHILRRTGSTFYPLVTYK